MTTRESLKKQAVKDLRRMLRGSRVLLDATEVLAFLEGRTLEEQVSVLADQLLADDDVVAAMRARAERRGP